jgi:sulfite reductase (ferredoxin)
MEAVLDRQRGAAMARSHQPAGRRMLTVTNVATPSKPPSARLAKRSKVEIIKEQSDYLRHPLMQELVDEKTYISEDAVQLMKFHGSYMQDHREKRAFGSGKFYQFMMRTRQPSGLVTNQLYLVMDDLADQVSGPASAAWAWGSRPGAGAGRPYGQELEGPQLLLRSCMRPSS